MPLENHIWPQVRRVGFDGLLVTFGDTLSEPANRAALAFRATADRQNWISVTETTTTLASCFVRFDPLAEPHAALEQKLTELVNSKDWFQEPLPDGRKFWRVPTVYDDVELAPQLDDAAAMAGLSRMDAIASLSQARVRVQALGFAPGQPYLGALPECWDIPRQTDLTPRVSEGALVVAIRQFVLFSVSAPTGWRQVGQTGIKLFRQEADNPFTLRPGDEVQFIQASREAFENMRKHHPQGGAEFELIK